MAKTRKVMLSAYCDTVSGACGIGAVSDFEIVDVGTGIPKWRQDDNLKILKNSGGAGWMVAGFINTPECQKAYEILMARKDYKLVFQSPIRINTNSGREFFMCLWDTEAEKQKQEAPMEFV